MTQTEQQNVPSLRFPEFEGEWNSHKLSEAWQVKGQRNRDNVYGKEHVLSVSGEYGVINQIELLGRSYAGVSVLDYHVVDTGDIVYTKSPLKTNPYGIIKANLGPSGIVSTLYAVYKVSPEHSSKYWNAYFCLDDRTNKYLLPLVHKGAKNDMKINNDRVLIDPVSSPTLSEQRKIAEFLEAMDERIAQVTRKKALLEDYKKGCMQQIFSQSIRFKDDQGNDFPDWEEKRLGEKVQVLAGLTYSPDDIRENGTLVLRSSNVQSGEIALEDNVYVDLKTSKANMSKKYDILLCVRNGSQRLIGKSAIIKKHMENTTHGAFMTVLRGEDNLFIFQLLQTQLFFKEVHKNLGATINSINGSDLKKMRFFIPSSKDERRKIADFLSAIDTKIDLVAQELEQAKTFKKGLLQQMFV